MNQALTILVIIRVRYTAQAPIAPCRFTSTVLGLWIRTNIKKSNTGISAIRSHYPPTSILFTQTREKEPTKVKHSAKHNASPLITQFKLIGTSTLGRHKQSKNVSGLKKA